MRYITAGLMLTIGCACLHAQTLDQRATIPFDFRAGEKLMPAGDYTVHHSNGVLVVREEGGNHAAAQLLTIGGSHVNAASSGLEFHRYGERYYLSSIVTPWLPDKIAVLQSGSERAIARRNGLPEPVGIALRKP
jgi:hypothetical protein